MEKDHEVRSQYIDLDDLEYDLDTLRFLRKKLDHFAIDVFRQVINANRLNAGLIKTRITDYQSMRKKYDAAFITLEAQGFIDKREDGTATPYYVTKRGQQLGTLLSKEKKMKNNEVL